MTTMHCQFSQFSNIPTLLATHFRTLSKRRRTMNPRAFIRWPIVAIVTVCAVTSVFSADVVTVMDADSGMTSGALLQLTDDKLVIESKQSRRFRTSDLLHLRFNGRSVQPIQRGSVVLLANGDRLVAEPTEIDHERIIARWSSFRNLAPVKIPLETIRATVIQLPQNGTVRDQVIRSLINRQEENDVLDLKNGDRVTGELLELDVGNVLLETAVGKVSIPRHGIRAIGFNPKLISFPQTKGQRSLLTLVDGSRLTVHKLQLKQNKVLSMKALFGTPLIVPLSAIVTIQFLGGRVVYLSDLTRNDYRFTPFLSAAWQMQNDRNVAGGPLRLRGREYAKGLGMHSKSKVSYSLDGRYRRFHAVVGIDDVTGGKGTVVFAIDVDGERHWTSKLLTGKSPAQSIKPIDVTGAKNLTLSVAFSQFGDIWDYADWCDAVLVK